MTCIFKTFWAFAAAHHQAFFSMMALDKNINASKITYCGFLVPALKGMVKSRDRLLKIWVFATLRNFKIFTQPISATACQTFWALCGCLHHQSQLPQLPGR